MFKKPIHIGTARTAMKPNRSGSLFILFAFTLAMLLLLDGSLVYGEPIEGEEYQGKWYCLDCHAGQMVEWLGSPHSQAYENPEFRESWEALGSPEECLSCHTTGFDVESGTFREEGVTCEVCHGPGDTMNGDVPVELCGSCHTYPFPTYDEWKESGPSHIEATCTQCHDRHTSQLTAETPMDTCSRCHEFYLKDYEQTKHFENGIDCSACHMYTTPVDFEKGIPASTGHSFSMDEEQLDCQTCHDTPLSKHDVLGKGSFVCLSCHGEIHSLELKLIDGTQLPLNDSVGLCSLCHNERYTAWAQGTHGSVDDPEAQCVECHDPHDPVVTGFSSIPPMGSRTPAGGPSIPVTIAFVLVIALLGFVIVLWKWKSNV